MYKNDSKFGFVLGRSESHLDLEKINLKFLTVNSGVLDIGINI